MGHGDGARGGDGEINHSRDFGCRHARPHFSLSLSLSGLLWGHSSSAAASPSFSGEKLGDKTGEKGEEGNDQQKLEPAYSALSRLF